MTHRRPSRLPLRTHPCSSQKECHCLLSPQDGQWETSDTKLYMPLLLETSAQLLRSFPLDSAQKAFISQVIKEERVLWRIGLPRNQVHKVKKFFPPVSNGGNSRSGAMERRLSRDLPLPSFSLCHLPRCRFYSCKAMECSHLTIKMFFICQKKIC